MTDKLPALQRAHVFEMSILDEEKPSSLINIVPPPLKHALKKVPVEYYAMGEEQYLEKHTPDGVSTRLKLRFWDEWQLCVLDKQPMQLERIYGGVCTQEVFLKKVQNATDLAWIVMPPVEYEISLRETLYHGLKRLNEIIKLPITDTRPMKAGGKVLYDDESKPRMETYVNTAVVKEIRQTVMYLSDRVHGAIAQRLDIRQRSLQRFRSARALR